MSTDFNAEIMATVIREEAVLQKYEGEPLPENEFERIHLVDGEVVLVEKIENGEVVDKTYVKEV